MTMFPFLSNMHHFIQLYLCDFFAHTEEMASFYDEIDVKDDPIFPLLECDQINQADPETIENRNIYI